MPEEREQKVYEALTNLGIPHIRHEHPPVFTVEQAVVHWQGIEGSHCKNLFVRNKKGNRHYLIIAEHLKKVDIQAIAKQLHSDRLSFASDERLKRFLGVSAGEVSPFGLLQDEGREVIVILDAGLQNEAFINFHPNVNTATLTISFADLLKFLGWRGNRVLVLSF
ncbi:MAG: prolyl-tRNA synthetase associated domain-containing protein [Candidatus Aminicenantes bacterium]|nr:prolyl-tRNA synthetase associated domain-containing protein [Candidatus Aminicenantes bacterium]